ncbi:hypothetical protein NKG94_35720 [Micromonospora sp. M12]
MAADPLGHPRAAARRPARGALWLVLSERDDDRGDPGRPVGKRLQRTDQRRTDQRLTQLGGADQ